MVWIHLWFIIWVRMIFFEIEWLSFYMCKSSAGIKLYDFIVVINLSFPCVSFRWWSSIPLGEGGALFSIEGASNKVTINAA